MIAIETRLPGDRALPQEEASKDARATQLPREGEPATPAWARIPRGWIILALFALAWLGVYLIWNGARLLFHI